ncbi:MAG: hypothetical protein AB7F22_02475 [Reyranella sp.]|uniref:hypothetical protein n=1 Tax=Reyranella sp. TaxID=1929291 RepID=UPI003D131759
MRSHGIVVLAISGMLVTAYHVMQPAPELGVTPEMFNWGQGWGQEWIGWAVGFVASTLILALIIGMVIHLVRWLKGLRDLT